MVARWHTWHDCGGVVHRWWGVVHGTTRPAAAGCGKVAALALAGAIGASSVPPTAPTEIPEPARRAPVLLDGATPWAGGRPLGDTIQAERSVEGTVYQGVPERLFAAGGSPALVPALTPRAFAPGPDQPERTDMPEPGSLAVFAVAAGAAIALRRRSRA